MSETVDGVETPAETAKSAKTMGNTTASHAADNVSDIKFWGNGDMWKLLSKASSEKEGWMKSSKAMEIFGIGCVLQTTTQQWNEVTDTTTLIPNTKVFEHKDADGKVTAREIVPWDTYDIKWMSEYIADIGDRREKNIAQAKEAQAIADAANTPGTSGGATLPEDGESN
jgi:hypothetical protein